MKKLALVLVAMLTMVFTGCKTETSTVTIYVEDSTGEPVALRPILYADLATIIIEAALPSPESLATGIPDGWNYIETNRNGIAQFQISLSVSKMDYVFDVWDNGRRDWVEKTVKLHRGENEEIKFVVQN